jgi:hypothetical protein
VNQLIHNTHHLQQNQTSVIFQPDRPGGALADSGEARHLITVMSWSCPMMSVTMVTMVGMGFKTKALLWLHPGVVRLP